MKALTPVHHHKIKIVIMILLTLTNAPKIFSKDKPFYYRIDLVTRAKENVKRHEWAKKLLKEKTKAAQEITAIKNKDLLDYIPRVTPSRTCNCPNCGKSWLGYIWKWDHKKPNKMTCRFCKKSISGKLFPANETLKFPDPSGKIQKIPYFKKGNKKYYILSGIAVKKFNFISKTVVTLIEVWLLTNDKKYADKAIFILSELAKSYPGYVLKEWDTNGKVFFRKKPTGRAGKMSGWHYQDAITVGQMARAYDALKCGGMLNAEQITLIERGLFKSAGEMLTGVPVKSGVINDRAQRFAGVASIARVLNNHKMMQWVTSKKTGFLPFIKEKWFQDGHWCERSFSYDLMAISNIYITPWVTSGYRSSKDSPPINWTKSPIIKKIHTALFDVAWPNGDLPSINDSHFKDATPPRLAEIAYAWSSGEKELQYLIRAYKGKVLENGDDFALWNRDPSIEIEIKKLKIKSLKLNDRYWKNLAITQLRTHSKNQTSVVILDHGFYYGAHSHADKLQLLFWTKNREMSSDLGYVYWGHKLRTSWLNKTLAHNTVLVNSTNQNVKAKAQLVFKRFTPTIKVVEAKAPSTYKKVSVYQRTVCMLTELSDEPILIDIFRIRGGTSHDFSFHTEAATINLPKLKMKKIKSVGNKGPYRLLKKASSAKTDKIWKAEYQWPDGAGLRLWMLNKTNTEVIKAMAPGQRLRSQEGRKLPWLIVRRKGENLANAFISIQEPLDKKIGDIVSVELIKDQPNKPGWPIIIKITGKKKIIWAASRIDNLPWPKSPEGIPPFPNKHFSVVIKPIK